MELAIINGTYRDTTKPTTTQSTQPSVSRKSVSALDSSSLVCQQHRLECSAFHPFYFT